jgi:hypothetical protein
VIVPLLPQHQALLDASAITAEVAEARGYYSVNEPKELTGLFGPSQRLAPALVIPVRNVRGEVEYFQLRPDNPRVKDGRTQRYEIPARARMPLDVPPGALAHLGNPKVKLWITEGIRKADSLASIGLRSIALLGVWNWRGRGEDGGTTILEDFEYVALNERQLVICFDSDAFQNPGVHRATERLGRVLEHRGAELSFVYLPSAEDGSKQGVDDYLGVGHSKDELMRLIERRWEPLPSQARAMATGRKKLDGVEPCTTYETVEVFRHWLHLPTPDSVLAVLGAIAANRLDGDPVWLLLVAAPSAGKTEPIMATSALPDVHPAATLTEAALLSGSSKRDHAGDATGGMLRTIGEFGVIALKDFTSILSMNRDSRAQTIAALREVYDGSWTRQLGVDGGRTLHWQGKVGLVGGCTPVIDDHHSVMAAMGERLLLLRIGEIDVKDQARKALKQSGQERQMREQLSAAIAGVFVGELREPQELSEGDQERLISLATVVVKARSAVGRDSYTRQIDSVPDAERPARLVKTLRQLLHGFDAIGVSREDAWRILVSIGFDCLPKLRRLAFDLLRGVTDIKTGDAALVLGLPVSTISRAFEDLVVNGNDSATLDEVLALKVAAGHR